MTFRASPAYRCRVASRAYYNEIDPYAAQWLRNLIAAGHIAPGDVDERSIEDVNPDDLRGYTQCHFFAGIGVWSRALRLAGWPDSRPVWTGSCPCQPFSAAGKGGGFDDERHLWPAFHHLISQRRPPVVFGEQVASKDGLAWLDLVQTDLEGADYAAAAVDLCAAGVGAPHIRQRLYWVADAHHAFGGPGASFRYNSDRQDTRRAQSAGDAERRGGANGLAFGEGQPGGPRLCDLGSTGQRWDQHRNSSGLIVMEQPPCDRWVARGPQSGWWRSSGGRGNDGMACGAVADPDGGDTSAEREQCGEEHRQQPTHGGLGEDRQPGPTNSFWRDADWLFCRDGKWRPVEPGTFPLAHGAAARVGRLRAYGNAIVPQVAAEVIAAFMDGAIANLQGEKE